MQLGAYRTAAETDPHPELSYSDVSARVGKQEQIGSKRWVPLVFLELHEFISPLKKKNKCLK